MRPFWRSFWASLLAYFVLAIFTIIILNILIFTVSNVFNEKNNLTVRDNTILEVSLDFEINERSGIKSTNNIENPIKKTYGLHQVKKAILEAKNDDNIKGILLNVSEVNMGLSSLDDLRSSFVQFKETGKFIIAYSENYSMGGFYLCSAADEIYLYPQGMVDFRGLGSELMFFKNALERFEVDVQVIKGNGNIYKGAVEPFTREAMSTENRTQIKKLLLDIWKNMTHNIKDSRNISLEKLNEIADSLYSYNSKGCLSNELIDGVIYEDQIDSLIKKKMNISNEKKLNYLKFKNYLNSKTTAKNNNGNIAIIYATGDIISGKSTENSMGSKTIVEAINKSKDDSSIKGIVIRVNSPGGSALASDVIWRSIELAKKRKPVVVSMGDVAASGGYYISCGADRIFAEENTVTGSIGVFGIIPNIGRMLKSKVGITTDRVETNQHSALTMFNSLDKKELSVFQKGVNEIYDNFISRVAHGRDGLKKSDVHEIAKGRIWSGKEAMDLELVDEIGNLNSAIEYVANKINIKKNEIKLIELPKKENDKLLELLSEIEFSSSSKNDINEYFKQIRLNLKSNWINNDKIDNFQMFMPFDFKIQ